MIKTNAQGYTGRFIRAREVLGKNAMVEFFRHKGPEDSILVETEIKDFKVSYGKERYLVVPVAGRGAVWVDKRSVSVIK